MPEWVTSCGIRASLANALLVAVIWLPAETYTQDDRPELTLRARPNLAFAPAEISFTGRLQGGPDDHEDFYCVSAEWDWDDGTKSESTFDCEPYEPGNSEIRRRFSRRHSFSAGGRYEVRLTLKRSDKVIESARTSLVIHGGRFPRD